MWALIKECYRQSARFPIALPLLFALPVIAELVQHFVEYRIGLFASADAMVAHGDDAARMSFGVVKVLTLILYTYWVSRWLAFGRDGRQPVLGDGRSALLFAGVVAFGMVSGGLQLFGWMLLAPFAVGAGAMLAVGLVYFLLVFAIDIYISGWKVGAALGNARLGIVASFRIMRGNFWWSAGFILTMTLPLMIVHYALGDAAIGRPDSILWPILILDSLLVGYLATVLSTTVFLIARRAADRAGVTLAGESGPEPAAALT